MTIEELKAQYAQACQRVQETADAVEGLPDDASAEQITAADEANSEAVAEAERTKGDVDRREAIQRSRDAHTPEPLDAEQRHANPRGAAADEMVYRPSQRGGIGNNEGFFHDLALAKSGDTVARERLIRNNKQTEEAYRNDPNRAERAGDLTSATHMGEFVPPDWTNQYYAAYLRAGRPFADQCVNLGAPTTTSWNLPRITTGATAAVQTEGSALSNTDQVSDSITAILQTIGGYSLASYQLVDLAEPGMDQILFADLTSALNQAIDVSLLSQTTTSAQGLFGLTGINSVTFTQTTPTVAGLWPTIFQSKSLIEKNTFVPVDFILMHPVMWNWLLAQVDTNTRPLFTSIELPAFNMLGTMNGVVQGVAGNIDGIPVIIDANITVTNGAGTNESKIGLASRSALLTKESAPRFVATPIPNVTSLMWDFVAYSYLSRMFGRHPKKISAITGTGLVAPSGY